MNIEQELRELLLPVFGLDSIDEIKLEHSLIKDLGAESLDFVEIFHLIDRKFDVEITAKSLMVGGTNLDIDTLFKNGKLTENGMFVLQENFSAKKDMIFKEMTKVDLVSIITVDDLAVIVKSKIEKKS